MGRSPTTPAPWRLIHDTRVPTRTAARLDITRVISPSRRPISPARRNLKPTFIPLSGSFSPGCAAGAISTNELMANTAKLDVVKWPGPVVAFYLGRGSPASILSGAKNPDSKTRQEQLCVANFYVGQWQLTKGDRAKSLK